MNESIFEVTQDADGGFSALMRHWGYAKVNQVGSHIILETHEPGSLGLQCPPTLPYRWHP
jgi:hypothetical protein